jgi:hypothetical protein
MHVDAVAVAVLGLISAAIAGIRGGKIRSAAVATAANNRVLIEDWELKRT